MLMLVCYSINNRGDYKCGSTYFRNHSVHRVRHSTFRLENPKSNAFHLFLSILLNDKYSSYSQRLILRIDMYCAALYGTRRRCRAMTLSW